MIVKIIEKIKNEVPEKPGVYFWKSKGEIIYIGKSVNLKNRMLQYFKGTQNSFYTFKMVEEIDDFEFTITKNEKSALILEANQIEFLYPKYNILLKNNGKYPYLVVTKNKGIKFQIKHKYVYDKNAFFFGPFPPKFGLSFIKKILEKEFLYKNGFLIKQSEWTSQKINIVFEKIKNIFKNEKSNFFTYLKSIYEKAKKDDVQLEVALEIKKALEFFKKNLLENQFIQLKTNKHFDFIIFIEIEKKFVVFIYFYRWGHLFNFVEEIFEKKIALNDFINEFITTFYKNNIMPDRIIIKSNFKNLLNLSLFDFNDKFYFPIKGELKNNLLLLENNSLEKISLLLKKDKEKNNIFNELAKKINVGKIKNFLIVDNSFTPDNIPISLIMFYKENENIKNQNFFYLHKEKNKIFDLDLMEKVINEYIKKKKNYFAKIDLIITDGGIHQINSIKKILEKNKIFNLKIIGLLKNEKHLLKNIINENNEEIDVSKELFLFLSKIQFDVDFIAKKMFNKIKNNKWEK
ncbi:GIY-YIG nuclease family protein [[Mycoplasma] collis]|uniref:GIY-YIG nuclease family protein n=1 Tax=[Mycoplasma] collis TaxID=2127 RepID=UPI00051C98C5|nr:GIY-YIG nuclease family protein [[Mycoplasma] collis]